MNINNHLKSIIFNETGVNVSQKTRVREVVELRALYFTLLKDLDPRITFYEMRDSVGLKNHATVIHALKNYDTYEKYNDKLRAYKNRIVSALNKTGFENYKSNEESVSEEIQLLYIENKILKTQIEHIKEEFKIEFEVIKKLDNLLSSKRGTPNFMLIVDRLESFYNLNSKI